METINTPNNCKACGQTGDGNYCSGCGEPFHTHRLTVGHMLHEVWHLFTHLDKGFGLTVKQLVLAPGTMQQQYIEGRRSRYQKPFSFFFLCGTICALALYWIHRAVLHLYAESNISEEHYYQHFFTLMQMALVPVYALIVMAVFGRRYNFAEYLVILLYNTSLLFIFVCVANATKLLFGAFETGYIEIGFVLLYNTFTYLNLFNDKGKAGIIMRTLLSSILCFAISRVAMEAFIRIFIEHT